MIARRRRHSELVEYHDSCATTRFFLNKLKQLSSFIVWPELYTVVLVRYQIDAIGWGGAWLSPRLKRGAVIGRFLVVRLVSYYGISQVYSEIQL